MLWLLFSNTFDEGDELIGLGAFHYFGCELAAVFGMFDNCRWIGVVMTNVQQDEGHD